MLVSKCTITKEFLYNTYMVHANDKSPYPNVHTLSISVLYIYYKINMLLTCILMSFFQPLPLESRPMISHHVTCHVTAVIYLFFLKKINNLLHGVQEQTMIATL